MSGKRMQARGSRNRKSQKPEAVAALDAVADDLPDVKPIEERPLPPMDPLDRPMTFRDLMTCIERLLKAVSGRNPGHFLMRSLPGEIRSLAEERRREADDARDTIPERRAG